MKYQKLLEKLFKYSKDHGITVKKPRKEKGKFRKDQAIKKSEKLDFLKFIKNTNWMQVAWMPSDPDWIWFNENDEMSGNDPIDEFWYTFKESENWK